MSTYPSTNPKKRDAAIKVMLTPELRSQLDAVSQSMGQTPSTAAAFAIGQWVRQQQASVAIPQQIADALVAQHGPAIAETLELVKRELIAKP